MTFPHLYNMYKNRINKKLLFLLHTLPFQKSNLLKAMKYSVCSSSKRFRACLVYVTGEIFGVNITTLDVISASIECIHAYSLIHDDLPCMDNDDFRRGKMSCHVKYGENISLLAGDALHSLAFDILSTQFMPNVSNLKRIKMISELSNSIGASGMCMGQILDLEAEKKAVNLSELDAINLYKTAFLMKSSVRLAYLASHNFSKSILSTLDYFSSTLGLAFQIQDDILDLQNDSLKENNRKKKTYPVIIGIKKSKEKLKDLSEKLFLSLAILKQNNNVNALEKLTHFIIKRSK